MNNIYKFFKGIRLFPVTTSQIDSKGELEVDSVTGKLQYHNGTTKSAVVTETHSATLTGKTIDADQNTITNIENADIKALAGIEYSKLALTGSIVNADVSATAAIADTKLDTISTAGKVSNSATTATNANTPSTIVARDATGNFSAGTITANVTGNVSGSAASFTGNLSGDVTGTQGATVVSTVGTSSAANIHSAELLANAATNTNTASTIVKRDGSGNFSAGTITANITGNVSGTASNVTDVVAIANGGTGQTTANSALNALLPSQTGNGGKVLLTDGANTSWQEGGGGLSAWQPLKAYTAGTVVTSQKNAFICLTNHTSSTLEMDTLYGYWQILNKPQINRNYLLTNNNFENQSSMGWYGAWLGVNSVKFLNGLSAKVPIGQCYFISASANVTVGDVYTNNGSNFTVLHTSSGPNNANNTSTYISCLGTGTALSSGTLTLVSGSGDATITYTTFSNTKSYRASANITSLASDSLNDSYSLIFQTTSLGTFAGDALITYPFTIDVTDQAKVLTYKFAYKLLQDTNNLTNFSGTNANTFAVAIFDIENGQMIQPSGCFNFIQKSGVGYCTGSFQTSSNSKRLQLAIYNPNTTGSSEIKLVLDDFYLGPQQLAQGPAISDYQEFTGSIVSWAATDFSIGNGILKSWISRVGDVAKVKYLFKVGSTTNLGSGGFFVFKLPSGLVIDTDKLTHTSFTDPSYFHCGDAVMFKTQVNNNGFNVGKAYPFYSDDSYSDIFDGVVIRTVSATSTTSSNPIKVQLSDNWSATKPQFNTLSGDFIHLYFEVPIKGWSSNSVMSSDSDNRIIAAVLTRATTQTISSTLETKVQFSAAPVNTSGTVDLTTNYRWTAPSSGYYRLSGSVGAANYTANEAFTARIKVNGTSQLGATVTSNTVTPVLPIPTKIVQLNAGDYVEMFVQSTTDSSYDIGGSATTTFLSIERLSGSAVVQVTDSIIASYTYIPTATGYPNNSQGPLTTSYLTLQKITDSTNSFNMSASTNFFTCPVPGSYEVSGNILFTGNTTGYRSVIISQSGSSSRSLTSSTPGTADNTGPAFSYVFKCLAGDQLSIRVFQNSGAALTLYSGGAFCIKRIGN